MPSLPSPPSLLHGLVNRNVTATATNATTSQALHVVCAFPVSGQYGPGSRALYYVLVAACVLARKVAWLRNACLAAALLFPAVAALHGIVLAALHIDTAVDMDVFGAFQLCSIGILAAPVTVRLSQTYFNNPGRNIIFVWTLLLLAGMLSLTVEFFRIHTSPCTQDDAGHPISPNARNFNYTNPTMCGLTCSINDGPFSPLRKDSTNNIYVIPAPDKLTFGTATLFAAACCIPAILSLVSMWNKILEINWKSRFGGGDENAQDPIEGTNGATLEKMTTVNDLIRAFRSAVEVPVFGGAVLTILIIGEMNFFSAQVSWETEPMTSIGQWAPIVGTGLAVLGSLALLLPTDLEAMKEETNPNTPRQYRSPPMREVSRGQSPESSHSVAITGAADVYPSTSKGCGRKSSEIARTISRSSTQHDAGNRLRIAETLIAIGNRLGTAAPDQFDLSEFKHGKAVDFPEIPGEQQRNSNLQVIRDRYNQSRDAEGNITPHRRQNSRTGSFTERVASGLGGEGSRAASPRRPLHASTWGTERRSSELQNTVSYSSAGSNGNRIQRRDTLAVPSPVHHSHTRNSPSACSLPSPAIVVSSDPETSSPEELPAFSPHPAPSPSDSVSRPPMAASPPSSWRSDRASP